MTADDFARAPAVPARLLLACAAGTAACGAAGGLAYTGRSPSLAAILWACGLIVFAAAAFWYDRGAPTFPRERGTAARAALVSVLAAVVLGWGLARLPPAMGAGEVGLGLRAAGAAVLDLFRAPGPDAGGLHTLLAAAVFRVFGANLGTLRATSAALGVASAALLFAVACRLWDRDVAVLAAVLLVVQPAFIALGRDGGTGIDAVCIALLVVWTWLRLWQDGRIGAALWCGIALGCGMGVSPASHVIAALLALTAAVWIAAVPAAERRRRLAALGLIAIVALAVAAPRLGTAIRDAYASSEPAPGAAPIDRPAAAAADGRPLDPATGLAGLLAIRTTDGATPRGLATGLRVGLLALGALLVLGRIREPGAQLVVLWAALPIAAAALSPPATTARIAPALPFAAMLTAVALGAIGAALRTAVPGTVGRMLVQTLTVAIVALIGAESVDAAVGAGMAADRGSPEVEVAAWIQAHGTGRTTYVVGSAIEITRDYPAIAFRAGTHATRAIDDLPPFLRAHTVDADRTVFVFMADATSAIPDLERAIGPLSLQTHRARSGAIAFVSAVPDANGTAEPPDPAERFDQPAGVDVSSALLATAARDVMTAAGAFVAIGGAGALLLAGIGWVRRPRRPGVSALRVPLGVRIRRWRERAVGPDEHERRGRLPAGTVAVLLIAVVAVALALRVVHLADLPAGFFCDEAGNGFNSYSLLGTGRDETGARWPLYVWSFGVSYKNPIFLYSSMLPMALLGPTALAVRLTAALYGAGTVLAIFFLGRALMGPVVGLVAALLLAVCPWHLHFSRIGYELITLPFFFTLGLTSLVHWTRGRRTLAQALVLLGLSLYTYVPAKLVVPLFLAGFAVLFWRALLARWRETLLAGTLLLVTAAPVAIFDLRHAEQAGSYFHNTTLLARAEPARELVRTFAANYAAFFSPEFLFENSTDRIVRHRVAQHGELYPFFAPLLLLGTAVALVRRDRAMRLPLLWLGLYPIAPALMNEIPSASRGIAGAPAFCIVAAIGAGALFRVPALLSARRRVIWAVQAIVAALGLAVLVPAARHYWTLYRDDYPLYSAKYYTGFQYGHRQVVDYFRAHDADYDVLLLTTRLSNQPEVFLRFYDGLREPPDATRVPPYEHRENMRSGSPEAYELYTTPPRRMLFAVLPEEVPLFADPTIEDRVIAPDGTAAFVLVSASRLKDFVSTWRVQGLLPEDDDSPPPAWTPDDPPPRSAGWRLYRRPAAGVGLNDFFVQNADHACAWAVNFVTSPTARTVRVFAGFDDRGEVWVNGERIALEPTDDPDASLVDAETATAELRSGRNTIAVRTCEVVADWRFYFRLESADGSPLDDLHWQYGPR
jgi:4-amino-4-deoxy-L-arabinose transferase-like glycosyltransferase